MKRKDNAKKGIQKADNIGFAVETLASNVKDLTHTVNDLAVLMSQGFINVHKDIRDLREDMMYEFKAIDERFAKVDQRFDEMNYEMNKRFAGVDKRFNSLTDEMNERFASADKRFEKLETKIDIVDKKLTYEFKSLSFRVDSLEEKTT
jgi:chaperonin cofactor prefoldin